MHFVDTDIILEGSMRFEFDSCLGSKEFAPLIKLSSGLKSTFLEKMKSTILDQL